MLSQAQQILHLLQELLEICRSVHAMVDNDVESVTEEEDEWEESSEEDPEESPTLENELPLPQKRKLNS